MLINFCWPQGILEAPLIHPRIFCFYMREAAGFKPQAIWSRDSQSNHCASAILKITFNLISNSEDCSLENGVEVPRGLYQEPLGLCGLPLGLHLQILPLALQPPLQQALLITDHYR